VVHLGPNANGLMRRWGLFAETFGGCEMQTRVDLDPGGNQSQAHDFSLLKQRWQHPWHLVPRVRLFKRLREAATAEDREGIPVVVHTVAEIASIDCGAGRLVLVDGASVSADVLVGADGAHVSTYLPLRIRR